ncbi:MAG TPA: DUF881 domain-containing protein [Actinomycetaceae bacterium]|nr:DUF881 domain-containing protein [Actinomycetaceae bacterium]
MKENESFARRELDRWRGAGQEAAHRASIAGSATQGVLRQLLDSPLDSGYRTGRPTHEPGTFGKIVSILLIALMTTISVWAARELQRVRAGTLAANAHLVEQVHERGETLDQIEAEIQRLDTEIVARRELLAPADSAQTDETRILAARVGLLPIRGEALIIDIDDSAVTSSQGRVRDFDLQVVTNALWGLGADGIAVNGERLSSTTALRTAGQAILVNLVPLSPPYRVEAVGDAGALQVGLAQTRASGHLAMLRDTYGVTVQISVAASVELPAAPLPTIGGHAVPIGTDPPESARGIIR